jgi:hydrogenase/urease accessory protein HupE
MNTKEIIYSCFYCLAFVLSIITGTRTGFTGTHTPPIPFVIELFTLPIGFVLFFIDNKKWQSTRIHKLGLISNGFIMALILFLALK